MQKVVTVVEFLLINDNKKEALLTQALKLFHTWNTKDKIRVSRL